MKVPFTKPSVVSVIETELYDAQRKLPQWQNAKEEADAMVRMLGERCTRLEAQHKAGKANHRPTLPLSAQFQQIGRALRPTAADAAFGLRSYQKEAADLVAEHYLHPVGPEEKPKGCPAPADPPRGHWAGLLGRAWSGTGKVSGSPD